MKIRKGYLIQRGKTYYACWTIAGKKFMKTTGETDRRDAEKRLAQIMMPFLIGDEKRMLENVRARIEGASADLAVLAEERDPPITLQKAWTSFVSSPHRPDAGELTLREYQSHYEQFLKWIESVHAEARAMRDVSRGLAAEYAGRLMARGLSANRFNKHVRFLEMLFRVLEEPARLTANPWSAIPSRRLNTQSRRELTVDELQRVCKAATGELRLLFGIGIYTGLRLGDCATLRWGEVDIHRGIIRRVPSKTSRRNPKPILIPIHAVLRGMLENIPPTERQEFVLPETAARYQKGAFMLTVMIQEHFQNCGIRPYKPGTGLVTKKKDKDGEPIPGTGKRAVVEVGFHSLRHTFVSLCREANAPLSVVESIVGHSNPAMTRHYTHTGEAAAMAAVASLPGVMGDAVPKALPAARAKRTVDVDAVRALAERLTDKNANAIKADLLALVS